MAENTNVNTEPKAAMGATIEPRVLLLYLINRLEEEKCAPSGGRLVQIIAEMQRRGIKVYTSPGSSLDQYIENFTLRDLQDCEGNCWINRKKDGLSLSNSGKKYLMGVKPPLNLPAGTEKVIEKQITQYRPVGDY